jgi:hypothetical protein
MRGVGDPPRAPNITSEAIDRAVRAERDYVNAKLEVLLERLRGIDKASDVLSETVNRTPTEIQKEIGHLRQSMEERFGSVALQFQERDVRSERESRDNEKAVNAAFAAQKESAAEREKSNALAISKSEAATTETITKLAELFRTTTDGLSDKIDDLKDRMNRLDGRGAGLEAGWGKILGAAGLASTLMGMVLFFTR